MNQNSPRREGLLAQVGAGLRQGLIAGLLIAIPFGYVAWRNANAPERAAASGGSSSTNATNSTNPAIASGPMAYPPAAPAAPPVIRQAEFGSVEPPEDVRRLANWVAESRDARGPFILVDKKNTHVYVFDRNSILSADTPVLLGGAAGDDSVDGIGVRAMSAIRPEERTTPAGRFVGERGHNANGEDVVWVDYDAAISMHRVRTGNKAEHRLQRLATPTTADNRISYGCINMPKAFYENEIYPIFQRYRAVIYVLPEKKSLDEVFAPLGMGRQA